MNTNSYERSMGLLLTLAVLLGSATTTLGATRTWDGSYSIYWSTPLNWTGGVAPVDGDYLLFPETAANKVNYNNLSGLNLQSIQFTGGGYTLQGNGIGLTGFIQITTSSDSNTIELDIDLDDSLFLAVGYTSSSLGINGNIDLGSYTLSTSGGGPITLRGIIGGTGGITKDGTCTVSLAGSSANTYTGETRVYHGLLELAKSSGDAVKYGSLSIGNGSGGDDSAIVRELAHYQIGNIPVTINEDGWLDVDNYIDTVGAITFNGGHAGSSGTGTLKLGGTVTVNVSTEEALFDGKVYMGSGTRIFDVGDSSVGYDLRVTAVLSGAGLTKTGTGLMALQGANTHTGATTVNEGRFYVLNNDGLGTTASGTEITGSGFMQLVSVDVGLEPLTLGRTYSGHVLYASGSCRWAGDVVLDEDADLGTGGTLEFGGTISGSGGITFIGSGDLILSGVANNTFTGPTVVQDGQLLMDKGPGVVAAISAGSLTIGDGTGTAGSTVALELGPYQLGSIPITVNGDGLLDLNNFNDTVGNSLVLNEGGDIQTGTGTLSLQANSGIACSSSGLGSSILGKINVGTGTCTLDVSDGNLFVPASVSGSGDILVTAPTASGRLTLSSSNSFTGTLTLEDTASLWVNNAWALGSTSVGTIINDAAYLAPYGNVHVVAEPLTMNSTKSSGALWVSSGANSWAGPVTLSQDTVVGFHSLNTPSFDLAGVVSGTGGITKKGVGTLRLSGFGSSYTGDTTVNEGVLELAAGNVIRYGTLVIGDGAGAKESVVVRFLSNFPIHSDADVAIKADGLLDFNNYTDDLGYVLFDRGQLKTGAGEFRVRGNIGAIQSFNTNWTATIFGNVDLGSYQRTFDIDTGSSFFLSAHTEGSGGIAKTGGGSLYLSSSNSYAGVTSVGEGRIYVADDYSLGETGGGTTVAAGASLVLHSDSHVGEEALMLSGTGSGSTLGALACIYGSSSWAGPVTIAGAARLTTYQAGDSLDLGGAIGGNGDVVLEGGGTVIYSGSTANTYGGDTYVNSGMLSLEKTAMNIAIVGNLYIGDGIGGADADVVKLANTSQIPNTTRITIAGSGLFDMNNIGEAFGSLAGSGHVDTGGGHLGLGYDNGSSIFSGLIEGTGELRKAGSGTFELSGNNTYSGDTRVYAGTLLVNGSQPGSDVVVSSSGTLGGIGTVGEIDSSGTVAPGASAGQLGGASATLQSGSTFDVELDGYALVDHDQLDVNGAASLGNANLNVTWGFVPAVGDSFTILDNDGADAVAGTFNGLAEGASLVAGNVTLQISYAGGTGNDVVLAATEVEELEPLAITSINTAGSDVEMEWTGGVPFYVVEKKISLTNENWIAASAPTRDTSTSLPADTTNGFYRVKGGN